jgi:hypothetical protein
VFDGDKLYATAAGAIADTADASFAGQLWLVEAGTQGLQTVHGSIGGRS